jgi:putative sporulation protein YtaF
MRLLAVILLGLSVSMDALFAGVAYGIKGIRVPGHALLLIGLVTVLGVAGAMGGGDVVGRHGETQVAVVVGAGVLIGLGLVSLLQTYLTTGRSRHPSPADPGTPRQLTWSMGRLVITIRAKPARTAVDQAQALAAGEAALVGVALGLDNVVAVFAVSLTGRLPVYTPLVMGVLQMLMLATGVQASAWVLSERVKARCGYVSGVLLLVLGVIRLV